MRSTVPLVLSAYRGQAKTGIGEGPDSPIAHGEQYLAGTAPALAQDGELLQAIRPWLSLDSDPADHQRLKDRLESWSCFCYRDWLFVVRLMSAGIYDRRAAYFSHARAWRLADCRGEFDPGVYLGCSSVFDTPQAVGQSEAQLETLRPEVLPAQWLARLQSEPTVASRFLGHLLQALEQGYPLLLAAPVREFTVDEALHTLLSFSRAALPSDLKYRCAIRVYTRQPERFSRHLRAHLIALPDDIAGEALSAQRNATLLDRQGEVKAGQPLESRAAAYAQAVLEGVLQVPRGLLLFSARFGPRHAGGLPVGNDIRSVQISYNLALALAGGEADRDYLFRHYVRVQAQNAADLPWKQLLDEQDWARFPRQTLYDFVLQPPNELTAGEQVLQSVVVAALSRLGLTLDERLPVWWNADDPRKLSRLLQLLVQAPALLSPAAAAERTAPIPLARLQAFPPLQGLLEAEFKAGVLGRRSQESEVLAELAGDPNNCKVLAAATKAGQLDSTWANIHIGTVDAEALFDAVRYLIKNPQDWPRWGKASKQLLDRLRERRSLPDDLMQSIGQSGQTLDFLKDWEIYIRLADLLAPADPRTGAIAPDNPLMQRVWRQLERLDSPKTHLHLVKIALDEQNWRCLAPASLVLPNGEPALPWADEVAEHLLSSTVVRERLNAAALVKLLRAAGRRLDREQIRQVYAAVTVKMRGDSAATTRALIQRGAWLGWRRQAEGELTPTDCRAVALAWLYCPLWQDSNPPEVTLETWDQVLDDLIPGLSGSEMQQLRGGKDFQGPPRWPWIIPFKKDQLAGLCRLAMDFGALVELVEAISTNGSPDDIAHNSRVACQQSELINRGPSLPTDALLWLLTPDSQELPVLTLEQSLYLYKYAGHRQSAALQARVKSVVVSLQRHPVAAIEAADTPSLWKNHDFLSQLLSQLAGWLCKDKIDKRILILLDKRLDSESSSSLISQTEYKKSAELMAIRDYNNIAEFLYSNIHGCLSLKALNALRNNNPDDDSWAKISKMIEAWNIRFTQGQPTVEDPLTYLAKMIYEFRVALDKDSWNCFKRAASRNHGLLKYISVPTLRLPAFELVASLLGNGHIAEATRLTAITTHRYCPDEQNKLDWWQALIRSITEWTRWSRSVDNREDYALEEICDYANQCLAWQQQQLVAKALRLEGWSDIAKLLRSEYRIERK
ncbi:MAG: hypothetical protein U1F76_06600 [Candidatus Competibacteraceae bacterium]